MKTLFFYEWKKIVNRKIVLICMLCAVLLIIFSIGIPLVGDYVVNGERLGSNYEEFQKDITYRKDLDGRAIDRTLLMEMQNAYEVLSDNQKELMKIFHPDNPCGDTKTLLHIQKEYEAIKKEYYEV